MFVPFFNLIMIFILGFKAREWAWRNRLWTDVEHFNKVQRRWSIAGVLLVGIPVLVVALLTGMKRSEAYAQSFSQIQTSIIAQQYLGDSISSGIVVSGKITVGIAGGGMADIQYHVSGEQGEGTAFVRATKNGEKWLLKNVIVVMDDSDVRIDVLNKQTGGQDVAI